MIQLSQLLATAFRRNAMARTLPRFVLATTTLLSSLGCDECKEYSDYTCGQIDDADYNVYFYYRDGYLELHPDEREDSYLGGVSGLESCQSAARAHAQSKNLLSERWDYVCCMQAKGSCCYEKHK